MLIGKTMIIVGLKDMSKYFPESKSFGGKVNVN